MYSELTAAAILIIAKSVPTVSVHARPSRTAPDVAVLEGKFCVFLW